MIEPVRSAEEERDFDEPLVAGRIDFGLDVRIKDDSEGAVRVLFDRDRARDQVAEPGGEERRRTGRRGGEGEVDDADGGGRHEGR